MENNKTTPMMQQWNDCKAKAGSALLFFRLGDFYEAFHEDAVLIAKELELTLTKRQEVPMCGVPHHAAENYIDKLIAKGYKVAIAEQMENSSAAKTLVKREITRFVSPGTVMSSGLLHDKQNNFFVCLTQTNQTYGLAIIDLTTADFSILEVGSQKELLFEFCRLKPKELLISKNFHQRHKTFLEELSYNSAFVITEKEDYRFDHSSAIEALREHFHLQDLGSFGLCGLSAGINAAGALVCHLKEELMQNLAHIRTVRTDRQDGFMAIDYICMRNLEIISSLSEAGGKTSLLKLLDYTVTPMGGRLLKEWVAKPLLSLAAIKERQEAIAEILNRKEESRQIGKLFGGIYDLERLLAKLGSGLATAKDLQLLNLSLRNLPEIKEHLKSFSSGLVAFCERNIDTVEPAAALLQSALSDNPPLRIGDGNCFKAGYNRDLDDLLSICRHSKEWLASYQTRLKDELKIKTLRVGFNRVFGYYIEVSAGQAANMPERFTRRQTLANCERFISEELKDFEHKMLTAEDRIKALEIALFEELLQKIIEHESAIFASAKAIALFDTLLSLAMVAMEHQYVCPIVDNSDILHIEAGRHPIIEALGFAHNFIANDTFFDDEKGRLHLITGPNMAGKSTYIRQVALIVIMAQIGSFVPAASAHIGVIDKVFSRIGASDDLSRGQSTFMVEMIETANILNNASVKSLVILDEIGRGTSTYDGISIAWAVAEYLATTPNKNPKTLFATHYWELTEMENKLPGVKNLHVAIKETDTGIVFLRKIAPGSTDKSYGIHVAKLAGLPFHVLKKAQAMLAHLEKKAIRPAPLKTEPQLSLFDLENSRLKKVEASLKNINTDHLTPMDALIKLQEITKELYTEAT